MNRMNVVIYIHHKIFGMMLIFPILVSPCQKNKIRDNIFFLCFKILEDSRAGRR